MNTNKNTYIIAGGILFIALAASGFMFYTANKDKTPASPEEDTAYELIAEDNGVVLMADTGLDAEWLIDSGGGKRQIFERYRAISKEDFENLTGAEAQINSIDITEDNAEVFLTHPDGTKENIAGDIPYVKFSILPPQQAGGYKLDINLNSGEQYNFVFEFNQPREVALTDTGKTITQQKPEQEEGIILNAKEQIIFNELDDTERESRELHAFQLGDLDLHNANKAFYMTPDGGIYGGASSEARDVVNIGEYFWLDTEALDMEYAEREEFMQDVRDLENPDPDVLYELERLESTANEHIFLAKINGVWYYNISTYPF